MSNSPDLKVLRDKREEILKAELAAWLHDAGKLHSGHQTKYLRDKPRSNYVHTRFGPGTSKKFLEDFSVLLPKSSVCNASVDPEQIIRDHHKRTRGNCAVNDPMVCLVQRMDWIDSEFDRAGIIWRGAQSKLIQPTSSRFGLFDVFGFERYLYKWSSQIEYTRTRQADCNNQSNEDPFLKWLCALKQNLSSLSFERSPESRNTSLIWIDFLFSKAAGDSRYSVNDISLWEHSLSVATLFKVFISWSELHSLSAAIDEPWKNKIKSHSNFRQWFRPQLLPLRIDGLGYLSQSNNVPDLLARRKLLQQVYDTWKDILEWEFPLAGEVYRDENGPVFLTFLRDKEGKGAITLKQLSLPPRDEKDGGEDEINPVLASAYNQAKNLEEYLRQSVIHLTQGDLTLPPEIPLPTYTQKRSSKGDEKSLGDLLREEQNGLWLHADKQCLHLAWKRLQRRSTRGEEICTTCGLRPQGFGRWYVLEVTDEKKLALDEWIHHYRNNHNPKKKWEEKTEEERKCLVCKAISRGMCGVCLERREERAKPWAQGVHLSGEARFVRGLPETVWLDEVADKNGRIALIVGYFPIEHWLDGSLVESLAMFKQSRAESPPTNRKITITDENGTAIEVVLGPKPVSYSRIRRVWETTRRFWQDVAPTEGPSAALREWLEGNEFGLELRDIWEGPLSLAESLAGKVIIEKEEGLRPRLFLKGSVQNGSLGPYHAYELEIQGRKVAVLWVPEDAKDEEGNPLPYRGGFWVIENLDYLDNVYGRSFQNLVQELVGRPLKVYEPTEYGRPGQEQATFTIARDDGVQDDVSPYIPLIPILAEPRTLMALVPADKAFDVVKAIKAKYEREMGRVRNRLPLHLGIVFADAHQPLRTILDAGRRMLKQQAPGLLWRVVGEEEQQRAAKVGIVIRHKTEANLSEATLEDERPDLIYRNPEKKQERITDQFKKWHRIVLLSEERSRRCVITWYVPAVMGDGQTEDHWYSYVFWARDKDGNTEPGKATKPPIHYYKTDLGNPWNPGHPWLVHAGELKPGGRIYFTPATFDFIFLDHGGRRFEIAYDEHGHRRATLHRPYLLDELEDLETCWRLLAGEKRQVNGRTESIRRLSVRQLHQIRNLIETKRAEWFENPEASLQDETFRRFCADVLQNAEWMTRPTEKELQHLTRWATSGLLADAVELFYHIMKQRPEGEFYGDTENPEK